MGPRKDSEICNEGNNSTCSNQGEEKKKNQRKKYSNYINKDNVRAS